MSFNKKEQLNRRRVRIRQRIKGTADRPRLSVYRSNKYLYAQIINDESGKTLFALSSLSKAGKGDKASRGNVDNAALMGKEFAAEAKKKKIDKVVFDRAGRRYHGRIKAFAEAAREGGLVF